jgi:hypothetical protein
MAPNTVVPFFAAGAKCGTGRRGTKNLEAQGVDFDDVEAYWGQGAAASKPAFAELLRTNS